MTQAESGTFIEAERLKQAKDFKGIARLIRSRSLSIETATTILDTSCFSAVEASLPGLMTLASLIDSRDCFTRQGLELLEILDMALSGRLADARALVPTVTEQSLLTTMLVAARLALSGSDVDQAAKLAVLLSERHPKGTAAHPDIAPILKVSRDASSPRDELTSSTKPFLGICASLKNEGDYLEEWVKFHAGLGVDRFYLYNNASTDDTAELIERLAIRYHIVHHFVGEQPGQRIATNHFLANHAQEVEWVAFIDGDEFINLERDWQVPDVLDRFKNSAAVACSWMN